MERMQFKTEVNKLLELMIHSLYSHKEIFLRELISNASDAIDKARFASLTDASILDGDGAFRISLIPDTENGLLIVRDNGIGMTHDEVVQSLGTIAHSGTKEFLAQLEASRSADTPDLIGQFGVGFYSSFMVADKVTVITRKAGTGEATRWESTADGTYTIEPWEKDTRGTDVILHLKEDEKKYLEEWELKDVVRKYSDFIEHPVVLHTTRPKANGQEDETETVPHEETINSQKAIWLKDKADITEEEYKQFYKHIAHDMTDPVRWVHFRAEGNTEFSALMYLPARAQFDLFYKEFKMGPTLYVRRVQIMEHCEELLPPYLRFVRGVVESDDLPLNVSREILQNNKFMSLMKKNITRKLLDSLGDMMKNDRTAYEAFYAQFGKVLKEGIHYDHERKEQIADLLLFESTALPAGELTTFADYISRMKEDQKEIYYITGATRLEAANSPYIEALAAKGYEILVMTDEIDDIIMSGLGTYKEKQVHSVIKGKVELDEATDEQKEAAKGLLSLMKDALTGDVSEVRLTSRLKESPVCLVGGDDDLDPQLAKMLEAMGQKVPERKRILEINPNHPLVKAMEELVSVQADSPVVKQYARMLHEQAVLLEGGRPKDPAAFAKAMTEMMTKNIKG